MNAILGINVQRGGLVIDLDNLINPGGAIALFGRLIDAPVGIDGDIGLLNF